MLQPLYACSASPSLTKAASSGRTQVGHHHDLSAGLLIGGKKVKEEQTLVNSMNVLVATPGACAGAAAAPPLCTSLTACSLLGLLPRPKLCACKRSLARAGRMQTSR